MVIAAHIGNPMPPHVHYILANPWLTVAGLSYYQDMGSINAFVFNGDFSTSSLFSIC